MVPDNCVWCIYKYRPQRSRSPVIAGGIVPCRSWLYASDNTLNVCIPSQNAVLFGKVPAKSMLNSVRPVTRSVPLIGIQDTPKNPEACVNCAQRLASSTSLSHAFRVGQSKRSRHGVTLHCALGPSGLQPTGDMQQGQFQPLPLSSS
jgi:hypothetical protein